MQDKPVALVTGPTGESVFRSPRISRRTASPCSSDRDLEHGGRAAASIEGDARVLQLDVTDQASIDAAAERIRHEARAARRAGK